VTEASGGSITAAGIYTAPPSGGIYHVVAKSVADSSKSATALVSVVPPCTALSGSVGKWQNISPPPFTTPANMEVYTVAANPQNGTVFAAGGNVTNGPACPAGATCPSGGTGILKSSDCGATWTKVSTGTKSSNFDNGGLWALLVDPVTPETMYVVNGYGADPTLYKSTDGAVNWTELNPDPEHVVGDPGSSVPFVQAIAIDPYDHEHLAVTFHENCASPRTPWCFSQSTDGGATWHEFNGPTSVPGFMITGWIEGASISILGPSSYLVLSGAGVHYTGDGGATWTLVMAFIDATSYAGSTLILSNGKLLIGNSQGPVFYSAAAPEQKPPFAIAQAPSLPVPMPRLPYQTGLMPAVMPLANAPSITTFADDGVNIYGSNSPSASGESASAFWVTPRSDLTAWKQMPDSICKDSICRPSNEMAYDSVNHIVYSANWGAGLWRLVAK
jgi:hypothetical protein